MMSTMIKILEEAIEKVKTLSEERQRYAAHVLEQIAGAGDDVYRLSDEERRLVREGTADLDAGRIFSSADMGAFWRRNRP
jgi:DNA-binding protein H-NS